MVLILSVTSLALAAVSAVSGLVIPRHSAPQGWDYAALEDYNCYHDRYLRFDCEAHHGQPYFDQCCHPRLANETDVPFPPQCGCDGNNTSSIPPSSYTTPLTPTPTYAPPTESVSPDSEPPSEPSSFTSSTPEPSPTPTPLPTTSTPESSPTPTPPPTTSTPESSPTPTPPPTTSTPESSPTPTPSPVSYNSDSSSNNDNSSSNDNNSSSNDNSSAANTGGVATFFYQDGNPGACGQVHSDSDFICAMDQIRYGDSGNASPLCGKQVTITNTDNGKSVTVTVADDCPTCDNDNSIDLSVAAFDAIASESTGEVPISWYFV